MKHFQALKTHCFGAIDILLPPRCPVMGEIVDRQAMVSPGAWAGLNFIADPLCTHCGIPLDFSMDGEEKCTACFDYPPAFDSARAALKYNDVSRDLILGFKHGDKTHVVQSFTPWLEKAGKVMLASADYLIPVPLHRNRLVARRYNQAALIAQALSRSVDIPHLPLALRRMRATPSQGHMTNEERAKNVSGAFAVNPAYREDIKGKNIILIDDVYTTGATVQECTKVLRESGATQIHILTLARVVR